MNYTLIFDYDGVIVDSLRLFMKYFLEACRIEKVEEIKTKKDFLKIFDGNMYESLKHIGLSSEKIYRIISIVRDNLLKIHHEMNLFPGMKDVLEILSRKHILVVITSNNSEVVRDFLKLKDIEAFREIYGSEEGSSKVEKINKVKEKYSGENYFYIGDTTGDIIEGKQAGVYTVAVPWGWHPEYKLRKEKPAYLVHSPHELLNIFS